MEKVESAKREEVLKYINDIQETAGQMVKTNLPGIKAIQLESINFRVKLIKDLMEGGE